ncbi:unnamed protein product [Kluyveromyces dobzhanskii CBS 2104]|uniref:WGS project CCBQ000000000 data, contig 00107 n=1 Tax=Kluyveromyces dobzhanskii CBS 2104 TaxID=1427455 RepID=A0A0A8L0Y1_9SACH|nr:unnamed protein product [Kluyveromyces dobzhanskii CBS 2104]
MKVDEWSICSEFDNILEDVRTENVPSEKIWVTKSSWEPLYDFEFDVNLDLKGEVGFYRRKSDKFSATKVSFDRVSAHLYELSSYSGSGKTTKTKLATFQSPKRRFRLPSDIESVDLTSIHNTNAFDPEVRLVCGDSNGGVYVFKGDRGCGNGPLQPLVKLPEAHASHVTKTRFFPNGHGILSSSIDMQLKIWDSLDGTALRTFVGHTRAVNDFAMIDRGRNFVSGSSDGSLKLWECSTAACIFTVKSDDGVNCVSLADYKGCTDSSSSGIGLDHSCEYNTEGKAVFAGHDSGIISFHDIYNRKKIFDIPSVDRSSCVSLSCPSAESGSHYLFAGYSNGIVLSWDTRDVSKPVETLFVNENDPVSKLFLAHNSLNVASGVQFAFSVPVNNGKYSYNKLKHFIRSNYEISDFCVDESHQEIWCAGNGGTLLKF